ncbi:MAG: S8 family serine peptidase [Gemmatimonadaceae bacterium]|nr:S8 family serine peptidase [Gemmatimonadaceae bacterium]
MLSFLTAGALCLGCMDPTTPPSLRLGVPVPTVDLGFSEGCARFQVSFDAGGMPLLEPIYNTAYCQTSQIELIGDSASFVSATGALRIRIRLKNLGTGPLVPRVRLRLNADSVKRFDASGEVVPGASDLLGYQPDSASTSGRQAFWFYDAMLASGQPQMLFPGEETGPRWVEVRGTTWTARVRIKMFAGGPEQAVPATSPDTIPTALITSLDSLAAGGGKYFRSQLLTVLFHDTASQASRQAVLAKVRGYVVGGTKVTATDGWYVVRVPSATTVAALGVVQDSLTGDPRVINAYIWSVNDPDDQSWIKPNDGANWERASWSADAMLSQGANAALERIRAPLAWGCSIGSTSTVIGALDDGFHSPSDLSPNIGSIRQPVIFRDHGTRVASVTAARGNNDSGMTGVMWQAHLLLRSRRQNPLIDTATTVSALNPETAYEENLIRLARQGASIVILTANLQWPGGAPDTVNDANARRVLRNRNLVLGSAINRLRHEGRRPLFVMSAGNDGLDARYGGMVNARSTYPEQVLVVGGLAHGIAAPGQGSAMKGAPKATNRGPFVDVYAPGENIALLDSLGKVTLDAGTSFAAPLVAGVAGLVKSFYPALPDTALKNIILSGATEFVATDAGLRPVLDAYGALRRIAERPGAPLCGNRLWVTGSSIAVQRGQQTQTIAAASGGKVIGLDVLHGGRQINYLTPGVAPGERSVTYSNGSWLQGPQGSFEELSGTARSMDGNSHGLDSSLIAESRGRHADTIAVNLYVAGTPTWQVEFTTPPLLDTLNAIFLTGGFPMVGPKAYLVLSEFDWQSELPVKSAIYRLDLVTHQVDPIGVLANVGVVDVGFAEDNQEKMLRLVSGTSCIIQWSRPTFGSSGPTMLSDSLAPRRSELVPFAGCEFAGWAGRGAGGIAPRVVGPVLAPWRPGTSTVTVRPSWRARSVRGLRLGREARVPPRWQLGQGFPQPAAAVASLDAASDRDDVMPCGWGRSLDTG